MGESKSRLILEGVADLFRPHGFLSTPHGRCLHCCRGSASTEALVGVQFPHTNGRPTGPGIAENHCSGLERKEPGGSAKPGIITNRASGLAEFPSPDYDLQATSRFGGDGGSVSWGRRRAAGFTTAPRCEALRSGQSERLSFAGKKNPVGRRCWSGTGTLQNGKGETAFLQPTTLECSVGMAM
ncbi:unnamed protein product [Protopolystoma xenopodis]|uniref:Uncharacterized protein n=1 Tax=Protopolystoma xenopodis TaxID=117903 RepID=A0A3S5CGA4_9PLAT|nr:unnamed protein product [Protopolystoma xenopodis]